ncbi:MAG: Rne/Rng family ribonuclease [Thermaurantimonas sp.]|uniref:Rne/Rng family ribonuclease n=1 Tax=Thermaurantimonas sp. TaxID=2681568 RepID=UPI00391CDD8B
MSTDLYIHSRADGSLSIALMRDGKLIELHNEKDDTEFNVGDIYLGKVMRLVPGLNAAFVEVGYEKDAFLHYHDLGPQFQSLNKFLKRTLTGRQLWNLADFEREEDINKDGNIEEVLKPGQLVLVQIAKEPISTKGPRLSSEISIAGRFLVLVPFTDKVSVSQKIKDKAEKQRLVEEASAIRPPGFGIIVRTVAEGKTKEELKADLDNLIRRWRQLHKRIPSVKPPGRVLRELNIVSSVLRDVLNDSFENIIVDDENFYNEIINYLQDIEPEKKELVKLYKGKIPMFDHFGIERQIKTSFGRSVPAGKGAYLIIEHTEAMHVIDVNSGNRTNNEEDQEANALAVNLVAAEEVARQLRLRDMGGIIVVDFIDMHRSENKKALYEKLKEEMAKDRAKHKILPPSKFGLIEITRQRVRPELNINTKEENPETSSEIEAPIAIIDKIEKNLEGLVSTKNPKKVELHVHPFVAAYINQGFWPWQKLSYKWKKNNKLKSFTVIPRDSYKFLEFHFYDENGTLIE